MAKNVFSQTRWQGIADFDKESPIPDQVAFMRSVDYRTNPRQLKLLPKTTKESSTTVTGLVKWATQAPDGTVYLYDDQGFIYSRSTGGTYTKLHHAPSSHGNGMWYWPQDDYVYYTTDYFVGRYGPLSGTPQFNDNFLISGGLTRPTNVFAVALPAAQSSYLEAADSASLSLTSDLTINVDLTMATQPADGQTMTVLAKWDESGAKRSYIMDVLGIAGANSRLRFGISSDGTTTEYATADVSEANLLAGINFTVTWKASTATTKIYKDSVLQTTTVGSATSIFDSTTALSVGSNKGGGGTYTNFLNGIVDNIQIFNAVLDATTIGIYTTENLYGNEPNLVSYYNCDYSYDDITINANDLTPHGGAYFNSFIFVSNQTIEFNEDLNLGGTGSTYTVPTSLSELPVNTLSFTPTKNPQQAIKFFTDSIGAGSLTVTIHDQNNNTIATATMAAGLILANPGQAFVFSTPWHPIIGNTYHAHVTSSAAGMTLVSSTLNDLSTAECQTYWNFLDTDTDFHPVSQMLNFMVFGNGRYIATWDGLVNQSTGSVGYTFDAITLAPGLKVRSFAYWREFLSAGIWRGSTIYEYEQGRVYFWDGISTTFNFFIDVPEGAINAMLGTKGELYLFAGYQGDLLLYIGGDKAEKIKRLPKVQKDKYVDIFPGAMTMWRTLLHYGICGNTNDDVIEKGVYSWGSINRLYPDSLSYDYPISTGNRTPTTVKIGMAFSLGRKLLIGWQDDTTYGVDVVDITGNPFASGTVECLIRDEDAIWRDQMALILRGDFLPLASGESIDVKYKLDRETNWHGLPSPVSTVGKQNANLSINTGRNREYQIAIDLFASGSTSPTVIGESLFQDRLEEEEQFPGGGGNG